MPPRIDIPRTELESAYKSAAITKLGRPNGQEIADELATRGYQLTMHSVYRKLAAYTSPDDIGSDSAHVTRQVGESLGVYQAVIVDGVVYSDAPSELGGVEQTVVNPNELGNLASEELRALGQSVLSILAERAQQS